jgi:hypothetical protein
VDGARAGTAVMHGTTCHPRRDRLIRDYCITKAELVLAAEEELLDRDRKLDEGQAERLRDAFARLAS